MPFSDLIIFSCIACVAVIAFSMQLNAPFREFPYIGLTAFFAQFFYSLAYFQVFSVLYSTLVASIFLTILSRILAFNRRVPITIYLVPGFWPIAPGAAVYKATFCFMNNNLLSAMEFLLLSIQIAGAITIGVSFVFVVPQKYFNINIPFLQMNRNGQFYE